MRVVDTLFAHIWASHKKLTIILVCEWIMLVFYGLMAYFYMADFIQQMINQSLVITKDSDLFKLWQDPPVQPEMRVFLFNYTNVEEWLNGTDEKLNVEELGPYVYQEIWRKKNITFHDDGTVSYDLFKEYHYLPEKSKGNAYNDIITTPNIPLFAAGSSMKDAGYFSLMGFKATINSMIDSKSLTAFVRRSVDELMWGYDDKLTALGRTFMPQNGLKSDQFGLLVGKNFSVDSRIRVHTGQGNIQNLGQIQSVNGNENYNTWADSDCDKIRGGDGSFMSPSMSMKTKLEITVVDLCRTIRLVPEKPVKVGHLNALRFLPDPNLWNYEHSDNFCYCPKQNEESKTEVIEEESSDDFGFSWFDGEEIEEEKTQQKVIEKEAKCKGNGLYHVGPCKFGAPLVTSWPHFFKTEPQIKTVTGLNPDADKHQFFMDFQPQMGIGMRAYVRLQFNLKMEKSAAFVQTSNLPFSESHIVPVMWFEDVIEQPPESLQLLLKDALDTGPSLALNSTIVAFTGLFMQICLYIVFVLWSYHKDN